jgi:hypothetical protein
MASVAPLPPVAVTAIHMAGSGGAFSGVSSSGGASVSK